MEAAAETAARLGAEGLEHELGRPSGGIGHRQGRGLDRDLVPLSARLA
jgi:hypothetical protein